MIILKQIIANKILQVTCLVIIVMQMKWLRRNEDAMKCWSLYHKNYSVIIYTKKITGT